MGRSAMERDFTLNSAAIRFNCNKHQPLFYADFRRLAAKKAPASSKNSFFLSNVGFLYPALSPAF